MKMRVILGLLLGMQGAMNSSLCSAEPWYPEQDPGLWANDLVKNFDQLPKTISLSGDVMPWSTTYWADYHGGVSRRWANSYPEDFTYIPPSLERLKQMIPAEKNKLSPAEKWDIYNSHYDYPTVAAERARTNAKEVTWAGICHGWSLASMSFEEPKSYAMTNNDGIQLDLYSTDIKALVSLAVSNQAISDSILLGTRCDRDGRTNRTNLDTPECAGVNPGTFHVVMANTLGVKQKPFVTNVSRDEQIWNHPVYGYQSEVLSEAGPSFHASPLTVREIQVETYLYEVDMMDPLTPEPVLGTPKQPLISDKYDYWLELDAQGNIVGGTWVTFWHPGFVWKNRNPIQRFTGEFAGLERVLTAK